MRRTRGQWPYIPASTRAMRNRHVMLYDLNYLNIALKITSDLKSATLITLSQVFQSQTILQTTEK